VDLDFGGTWTQDMNVSARLAIGKLILHVPADVGVRLEVQRVAAGFEHAGLIKRDDAWYSTNWETSSHKLHVRAETFFGKIDVRRDTH
jgi:predicted membrane protein